MENLQELELRKLAEWYRAFAEVGDPEQRHDRLKFAEHLERRAEELKASWSMRH